MLTPTGYPPPTQQPIWPTVHTAHSQHCGHTALPPGQKTNPRRRANPTQTAYAHPRKRAQAQGQRLGTWTLVRPQKEPMREEYPMVPPRDLLRAQFSYCSFDPRNRHDLGELLVALAFTRYCHYQSCTVYGIQRGGQGGGYIAQ